MAHYDDGHVMEGEVTKHTFTGEDSDLTMAHVCGDAEGQTACLTISEIKLKAESDCLTNGWKWDEVEFRYF